LIFHYAVTNVTLIYPQLEATPEAYIMCGTGNGRFILA